MISTLGPLVRRGVQNLWLRLRGGEDQLRFLSLSVVMEEAATPRVLRFTIVLISVTVASFLVWSAAAEINEVARGPGVVVPSGYAQVVQHLEGGIVAEVITREGDQVREGQLLVRLNGKNARNDLRQVTIRQSSLIFQAERLRALISNDQSIARASYPAAASMPERQKRIFTAMMKAYRSEQQVLEAQLKQRVDTLSMLEARRTNVERSVEIAKDLRDRRKTLVDRGVITYFEYLRSEDRLNETLEDQNQLVGELGLTRFEVAEFENRLVSLEAKFRDETNRELERLESEIGQNREAIAKLSNRVERLEIRAPVTGIVKGLSLNTIGEVVAPGVILMEIVPVGEQLVVEMRIKPQYIGQISQGQPVEIKVSSFDFARHGTIEGILESISAATFVDEVAGVPYYLGRVKLRRNYLGNDPNVNKMLPGMTVEANIVTGSKTILAYLLKPIHRSLSSALTER